MSTSRRVGSAAEDRALVHLQTQGLDLVERNYHCRGGEIDLVMRDGEHLVFVEVRYRRRGRFGAAAETVDFRKQQKLTTAASHYLVSRGADQPCRFDVVSLDDGGGLDWLRDAFRTG
jgi:putative endonuclease